MYKYYRHSTLFLLYSWLKIYVRRIFCFFPSNNFCLFGKQWKDCIFKAYQLINTWIESNYGTKTCESLTRVIPQFKKRNSGHMCFCVWMDSLGTWRRCTLCGPHFWNTSVCFGKNNYTHVRSVLFKLKHVSMTISWYQIDTMTIFGTKRKC